MDMTFKVLGLNHIGLAPKDSEKAQNFFKVLLSLPLEGEELVADQNVNTIMFKSASKDLTSPTRLEILEPTSNDSPIQKFLDKKGSGIHHLALTVDNVENAIAHLLSNQVDMVDKTPRSGAHNTKIAFVHPKSTGGLLVELVEQK
jgi:methylmalonyl-CoA/ethylmalonyl-CoA epimerase